jgi:hypothetical protein
LNIQEFETAIIDELKSVITDLVIESFPDKPDEYRVLSPKGAILVKYAGSKYQQPLYQHAIIQERKLAYEIYLLVRSLRRENGAYALLDTIRETLTGFQKRIHDPDVSYR